jgi:hypothetical protein
MVYDPAYNGVGGDNAGVAVPSSPSPPGSEAQMRHAPAYVMWISNVGRVFGPGNLAKKEVGKCKSISEYLLSPT